MGEISDMLTSGAEYDIRPVWKTKEGKIIEIEDMTDQHIINAYKYIKRMIGGDKRLEVKYLDALQVLEEEAEERGLKLTN